MSESKVPAALRAGLAAVLVAAGGATAYLQADRDTQEALRNQYVAAAASDPSTSTSVKLAMVMAAYYESSYRHIGTPYVDKLGKGQPLTVCNGLTGPNVVAGRYYSPPECYRMEKGRYNDYERAMRADLPNWSRLTDLQQATVLDFIHNKGEGAFAGSTMRRKLLAGDIVGACRENPKWSKGTVRGVSVVLPGLLGRGESNAELCEKGLT